MERIGRRSWDEWKGIVAEHKQSGLSARAFCKERSIGLASFYQWRKRIEGGKANTGKGAKKREPFIDMGNIDASDESANAETSPWIVTLELGGGMKLTLEAGRV